MGSQPVSGLGLPKTFWKKIRSQFGYSHKVEGIDNDMLVECFDQLNGLINKSQDGFMPHDSPTLNDSALPVARPSSQLSFAVPVYGSHRVIDGATEKQKAEVPVRERLLFAKRIGYRIGLSLIMYCLPSFFFGVTSTSVISQEPSLSIAPSLAHDPTRAVTSTVIPGNTITAWMGSPYGVAVIDLPLATPVIGQTFTALEVSDPAHRILFPYSEDIQVHVARPSDRPVPRPGRGRLLSRLGNLMREISREDHAQIQTVSRRVTFLFLGDAPMSVELSESGKSLGRFDVVPQADPSHHAQTIRAWWQGYTDAAKRQIDSADYPTWVENYLVAMLSGRLHLPLPTWYVMEDPKADQLIDTFKWIAGAQGVSETVFRRKAAGLDSESLVASVPLPAPPNWSPLLPAQNAASNVHRVEIEPMAHKVPRECFYIRYGSLKTIFGSVIWARSTVATFREWYRFAGSKRITPNEWRSNCRSRPPK